jgi:hypothetical protein
VSGGNVSDVDGLLGHARKPDPKPTHPKGWEPGVVWSPTKGGTLVVPCEGDADPAFWALVMADWGLDPALTEIVPDSVEIRVWDQAIGDGKVNRAHYYRCRIRPRRAGMSAVDVDELAAMVKRKRPRKPLTPAGGVGFVVNLSDWQLGKSEGGGTPATVQRISDAIDATVQRLRNLRRIGHNVDTVALVGLGDIVEQCSGHYASQAFTVDCTRREQLRLARLLVTYAVDAFAELAPTVVLGAVPGNHGENRNGAGKAYTTVDDNDDLAVFEQVGEALAQNPSRYDHVELDLASGLVLTRDIAGVCVGWTHMHQARGGQKGIEDYWRGQVMGGHPLASARILNTGHFHHLLISEATSRTVIQVPSMDGGSEWFTNGTGQWSPPGMVSYLVGVDCGPRGWSDLVVL